MEGSGRVNALFFTTFSGKGLKEGEKIDSHPGDEKLKQ